MPKRKSFEAKQKENAKLAEETLDRERKIEEEQGKHEKKSDDLDQREKALERKLKMVEEKEKKLEERLTWFDDEKRDFAEKKVKEMRNELQHEVDELKNDTREKDRAIGDLEIGCKETMTDFEYQRDYSKELELEIIKFKKKIDNKKNQMKMLQESLGVCLNESEHEKGAQPEEETESEEEKEEAKTEQEESSGPKEAPNSDVVEFTQIGYVWQINKKTQEYRAARHDKNGSPPIKGAPVEGRDEWNRVKDVYRRYNVWFTTGKEANQFLEEKDQEKINEEVQKRIGEKGYWYDENNKGKGKKGKGQYPGKKGKGYNQYYDQSYDYDDSWYNCDAGYDQSWGKGQWQGSSRDQWYNPGKGWRKQMQ